jgi:3-hydroxyacyl-CoA dehydrogenase
MKFCIRKVVVLGSGVMGSSIAGILAGNGARVVMLDMPAPAGDDKNKYVLAAKKRLLDPSSRLLYGQTAARLIDAGNFEDDLDQVKDADWVIEVIVEKLEPKIELFKKISGLVKKGCILSSNTSGISINKIAQGIESAKRSYFLGTHFFNPPRYMKLLEIIPAQETDKDVVEAVCDFAQNRLGKTIVTAKDSPNFIANRIGVMVTTQVLRGIEQYGISAAMADFLMGKLVARPASGSLRTTDIVGFDGTRAVNETSAACETTDAEKEMMKLPAFFLKLIESGTLGDKTKKGFYARGPNKEPLMLDIKAGTYIPKALPELSALSGLEKAPLKERVLAVIQSGTSEGAFLWYTLKTLFGYCAARIPQITDDFRKIDLAMRLGYNWELGPFELWDALGADAIIRRLQKDGVSPASWVRDHLNKNGGKFYAQKGFEGLLPVYISLKDEGRPVLWQSANATLWDLGDGAGALEITARHSAMCNAATIDLLEGVKKAQELCKALVITSAAKNFCVGADLSELVARMKEKDWNSIASDIDKFHEMTLAIKYSSIPVVAAPYNNALGGGSEICLYAHKIVAHSELTIGLVEVQAGLIPGGGGICEVLRRASEYALYNPALDTFPIVEKYARFIMTAGRSSSALHAKEMGFLRSCDVIVPNKDKLLAAAKEEALHLSHFFVPVQKTKIVWTGKPGYEALVAASDSLAKDGVITAYERMMAQKAAEALTGGAALSAGTLCDEEDVLNLERDGFVSLCKEEKTRERMEGILSGKPVRN